MQIEKMKLAPYLNRKSNPKWIIDLNVKNKTVSRVVQQNLMHIMYVTEHFLIATLK